MELKLEKWSVVGTPDPYLAPELRRQHLHGKVFGHPKHEDGTEVLTSHIVGKNAEGTKIVTSSGSMYELGEVDPKYEEAYSEARSRLFKSCPVKEGEE